MYVDRRRRLLSYHDTWISIDPIHGCPYRCAYCVLRHNGMTGVQPEAIVSPEECVEELLRYPLFVPGHTPLAIGNETDMLHRRNRDYLVELLGAMATAGIDNPIVLITKAPLSDLVLARLRAVPSLRLVFFLSYSGLPRRFEPNFTRWELEDNFRRVRAHGFPVVHYWRPLLPENSSPEATGEMLRFAARHADASVFIGLKLHPALTAAITSDEVVLVPRPLRDQTGEWIDEGTIERIYAQALEICPQYPLYRHSACALAKVLGRPNHTATVYRRDVCPPSHCPAAQRSVCEAARHLPSEEEVSRVISRLDRPLSFERRCDRILIHGSVRQEEFSYLLHNLNCPLEVGEVAMQNLYHGDIFKDQRQREGTGLP